MKFGFLQKHTPVLLNEVIRYLDPKPNENFVDCTLGFAGHAKAILKKNAPWGKVLGIELDSYIYAKTKEENIERLILAQGSYVNLKKIVREISPSAKLFNRVHPVKCREAAISPSAKLFNRVNGILFDLGMSSWHLEEAKRGFSFQKDEPLDMRYSLVQSLTAQEIVNEWSLEKITKILKEYGEERFAFNISKEIIVQRRKRMIKTTFQLAELTKNAIPKKYQSHRINPATKTFQALRIAVNGELDNLSRVLPDAVEVLEPGGRIVVISFHSLEDRLVKIFFKEEQQKGNLKVLTKKPVFASLEEIKQNHRSRSAKLRAAQKMIL